MPEVVSMVSAHTPERVADVVEGIRCCGPRGDARTPTHVPASGRGRPDGVDKAFAVSLLESAGGETVVDVLDLVMDSNTAWWP